MKKVQLATLKCTKQIRGREEGEVVIAPTAVESDSDKKRPIPEIIYHPLDHLESLWSGPLG